MQYVDVPKGMEELFGIAERYVAKHFAERRFAPERGEVTVGGTRYLLIRAQALSRHFIQSLTNLYAADDDEVLDAARAVLYELGRNMGRADAEAFRHATGVDDPLGRLAAGPVHFAFAGWGRVSILPDSTPSPDDSYLLVYDHPNSFESAAWLGGDDQSKSPVCLMNAGYSAGWCEVAFGLALVAVEVSCRACGAPRCRFVMAPPERIVERLEQLGYGWGGAPGELDRLPPFQKLRGLTEVLKDLSGKRDALEARLSMQEARLEDLFDHAHDIIQIVDMNGRFLYVNRRWHELLGYDEHEVDRLSVFEVIHADHRRPCEQAFRSLRAGEVLESIETVFVAKDGRQIAVSGNVTLRTDQGKAISTRGIFRDITEQRSARAELEQLLGRTRGIVDNVPVGILLYDERARCIDANHAAERILGARRDQLLAQNFRRIRSWRDAGLLNVAEHALAVQTPQEHEAWLETSFGRRACLRCRFVPLELAARPHLLLLTEDVTVERTSEQERLTYQNRLLHVHQLALDIARTNELGQVLQTAIDGSVDLVVADFGAIVLLDPATGAPTELFASRYPMECIPPGTKVEGRGVLGRIAGGEAVHLADVSADAHYVGLPSWHPPLEALLGLPVRDRGRTVAMLLLGREPGAEPFSDGDRSLLETVANLVALAIRTARHFTELNELNDKLETLATTDALMEVGNRRSFDEEVVRFHSGARRYRKPYGVLMADVDRFKDYNDRYGHPAGDGVLARVARAVAGSIRVEDRVFRYGGEELVLLLPQQTEDGLAAAGERLRGVIEAEAMEHLGSEPRVVTVSFGGAVFDPARPDDADRGWQAVVQRADEALYRAKERGRNCVVIAGLKR